MATTDLKSIIEQEFDTVNYTVYGMCENSEVQDETMIYDGYCVHSERMDKLGANSGYNYKQGDAFAGDVKRVVILGETKERVDELVQALIKIADTYDFSDNSSNYNHMYLQNANNLIWDTWGEGVIREAHRRRADMLILLSKNNVANYTV